MTELISVIVPVYKVEKYVRRCVTSILTQSYANFEVILVDDGSPDNCGRICDEFVQIDKRVKVVHKINRGLSDARNTGLDIAQGDLISFVDSDDWINREYLERLYSLLRDTDSDISVCDFVKAWKEDVSADSTSEEIQLFSNAEALEQLVGRFHVQFVVAWGKLFKRHLFNKTRFPIGRIHEDEFIAHKLLFQSRKVALTTAQLLFYRQRDDSIMGVGPNLRHSIDAIDAFAERATFLRQVGLDSLSSKTYRSLMLMLMEARRDLYNSADACARQQLDARVMAFRNATRETRQPLLFKAFVEFYYIAPKAADIVYRKLWERLTSAVLRKRLLPR